MARPDDPDVRLLRALRTPAGARGFPETQLSGLRAAGFRIESEAEAGWRLVEAPAALIADDILATLPAASRIIGREILVFEETGSTNDLAARAGDDGVPEGLVIFAEKQRAGRGRLGRVWESRPRLGLWFSVLLRPENVSIDRWPELTFCAALAVAKTAEEQCGKPARIKWPNDVLVDGRKIAGILLECHHRASPGFVVVGVGLNVLQSETDFAPELRERAGSLAMVQALGSCPYLERRVAAASLLQKLEDTYRRWPDDFAGIRAECERRGCIPPD